MFDRFSDRARKVMALARKEAQRFNHDFIGTEHILLGLIQERCGVADNVLKNLGVEINKIRSEIEKNVQSGPSMVTMDQRPRWLPRYCWPFTPRANKVLELSMEEANELGHNDIGTGHLLLGLLREGGGVAARVLKDLGLELEEVRSEVLRVLAIPGREKGAEGLAEPPRHRSEISLMTLARKEAQAMGHGHIGTEHLLLALLSEHGGTARRILEGLGVDEEKVRAKVGKLALHDLSATEEIPFSPLLSRVLQQSMRMAKSLGQACFDSRHLLLALAAEEDSRGPPSLARLPLDLDELRRRAAEALGVKPERFRRRGDP